MKVNILGTDYTMTEERLEEMDGYCDSSVKKIKIDADLNNEPVIGNTKENLKEYKKKVIRHEIVHAYMEESGASNHDEMHQERIVDWIAVMLPKMIKTLSQIEDPKNNEEITQEEN